MAGSTSPKYLRYETVLKLLGPALFPAEWIEKLRAQEVWILEQFGWGSPDPPPLHIGEYFKTNGLPDQPATRLQLGAAMSRLHFMEWQRGELQSWLEIRNIPIRRGHDGDTVDKEAFETAFLEEFPQHAREAQAQSETLRRHPARRGGYQKIDDEPVLMELRLEIEHDPSRSLRRAILDRADDLAGHTPEAKIRRITKKYKKKYGSEK